MGKGILRGTSRTQLQQHRRRSQDHRALLSCSCKKNPQHTACIRLYLQLGLCLCHTTSGHNRCLCIPRRIELHSGKCSVASVGHTSTRWLLPGRLESCSLTGQRKSGSLQEQVQPQRARCRREDPRKLQPTLYHHLTRICQSTVWRVPRLTGPRSRHSR